MGSLGSTKVVAVGETGFEGGSMAVSITPTLTAFAPRFGGEWEEGARSLCISARRLTFHSSKERRGSWTCDSKGVKGVRQHIGCLMGLALRMEM